MTTDNYPWIEDEIDDLDYYRFHLHVYRKYEHGFYDEIIIIKPWVTELPQIGHTIQFSHDNNFYRAKINEIVWNLGDTNEWMPGSAIRINALITLY